MQVQIEFTKNNGVATWAITGVDGGFIGSVTESFIPRPKSSYYDIHRHAKGDNEIAVTSKQFVSDEMEARFVDAFSRTDLKGGIYLDIIKIKAVAKNQPTLVKGKLTFAKGEVVEI